MLAPLFDEYDPALVAGALLAIGRQPSAVSETAAVAPQLTAVNGVDG